MEPQFIRRARNLAGALWSKSPRDNFGRLLQRFGRVRATVPPWTDGKHSRWNRLPYYLELFRAFAERAGAKLDFEGRRVLEIGAGPVLGFAPFALVEGATGATIVEPGCTEIRGEPGFRERYLWPLFVTHTRLRGIEDMNFDGFLAAVDAIRLEAVDLESVGQTGERHDIFLSKSCLEHIVNLESAVKVSRALSSPDALHVHYVDFSMHAEINRMETPFGRTYEISRAENPEGLTHPSGRGVVNLLRPPDVVEIFRRHFRSVHFEPLEDWSGRINMSQRHADWQGYRESDLTVANGILVARA